MRITKHFSSNEFASKDGHEFPAKWIESRLRPLCEALEVIRAEFEQPIVVTSGYRTPAHNKAVGGVKNSQHLLGIAVDFKVLGIPARKVAAVVRRLIAEGKIPKGGVGEYKSFSHYDQRGHNARWSGRS